MIWHLLIAELAAVIAAVRAATCCALNIVTKRLQQRTLFMMCLLRFIGLGYRRIGGRTHLHIAHTGASLFKEHAIKIIVGRPSCYLDWNMMYQKRRSQQVIVSADLVAPLGGVRSGSCKTDQYSDTQLMYLTHGGLTLRDVELCAWSEIN